MAQAVWDAVADGAHLAVQAGTGTGKSLAYLVPALQLATDKHGPVVVSTATIALQRQLVDRDLPRLADALRGPLGRTPEFAILKGRNNYLCLNKLRNGPEDEQDSLFGGPRSRSARTCKRLHQWAASTTDRRQRRAGAGRARPGVAPGRGDGAGVPGSRAGARSACSASRERARRLAAEADVIVTNHALLAIDTLGEGGILPEHRVVIVDEAHELVDRVTSVASGELSAVRRSSSRSGGPGQLADGRRIARGCPRRATRSARCSSPCPAGGWTHSIPALAPIARRAARRGATHAPAQVRTIAGGQGRDAPTPPRSPTRRRRWSPPHSTQPDDVPDLAQGVHLARAERRALDTYSPARAGSIRTSLPDASSRSNRSSMSAALAAASASRETIHDRGHLIQRLPVPAVVEPGIAWANPADPVWINAVLQQPNARVRGRLAGPEHGIRRGRMGGRRQVVNRNDPAPAATPNGRACVAGIEASRYRASTTLRRATTSWTSPVPNSRTCSPSRPPSRCSWPVSTRTRPVCTSRSAASAKYSRTSLPLARS